MKSNCIIGRATGADLYRPHSSGERYKLTGIAAL